MRIRVILKPLIGVRVRYLRYFVFILFLILFSIGIVKFSSEAYDYACGSGGGTQRNNCSVYEFASYFWIAVGKFVDEHEKTIETVSTFFVAVFTFTLWRSTDKLGEMAEQQGKDMARSIAESARVASAMEEVAKNVADSAKAAIDSVVAVKDRTAQQMRAYLMVNVGSAVYQEDGVNFAVHPQLINSGHTPAHKVCYWAKAAIAPYPLPSNFKFEEGEMPSGGNVLGPHQQFEINARVDIRISDEHIEDVKRGFPNRVYIWGVVTYVDVFDEAHSTKFCHGVNWFRAGDHEGVNGTYPALHNEAN